jgi:tetratricopeptide (TPR) repeat protein
VIKAGVPEVLFDFYGLGDEDFEEVCCNLLYYDMEIENPDLYDRPRKKQFGADITADRIDGSGIDAASCKCYKSLRKGQISCFVNEFLDYWDTHWKDQRVQRFVLCIPCDLRSRERRKEIEVEKARFAALGVKFEAWGLRPLSHRAREHADIKDTFFPAWRSESALGSPTRVAEQRVGTAALLSSADVAQIGLLQSALARQIGEELDSAQLAMKRGQRDAAGHTLRDIRADPVRWSALHSAAQARLLRMQGLLALQSDDTARCAEFLDQADALSPNDEPRARALLTLRTQGRKEALVVLQSPTTPDGALLRAGLLIETERFLEAQDILRSWAELKGNNAEWHRLTAYLACIDGNVSQALTEIETAESLAADWLSVIETGAIVRYAAALSSVARFRSGSLPEPVPPEFARQDDTSRTHLNEAMRRFALLAQGESQPFWRQRFELWHFACLALLPERAAEAQSACIALLNQTPVPAVAVFWSLARDYAIPLKPLIRRLEKQLKAPAPSIDDLQAAVACALAAKDSKKANAILSREATRFQDVRAAELIQNWRGRIALARKRLPAPDSLVDPLERAQALILTASKDGNWAAVDALLRSDAIRPEFKFLACTLLAGHGQWVLVASHMESLLEIVATAAAVRLAVHAWYHTGAFDRIPKVLDEFIDCFPGKKVPNELKRLRTYAAVRGGDLPAALPLATELATASGEATDQTFLIDLLINFGDVERAVPLVRGLLSQQGWKPKQMLRWVPALATQAPELARLMVQKAVELNPDPAEAGFWVGWSYRLGLDEEAHTLLGRFGSQAAGVAQPSVRTATMPEVIAYMKEQARIQHEMGQAYLRGDAPIHAIVGPANAHLAQLWHSAFQENPRGDLFIRSGNRATNFFALPVTGPINLYIDTTALLTIDQLNLLDVLDTAGLSLTFAHTLLPVLQFLAQDIRSQQSSRLAIVEAITQAVSGEELGLWSVDSVLSASAAHVVYELGPDAPGISAPAAETASRPEITLGAVALELARRGGTTAERVKEIRETLAGWQVVAQNVDPTSIDTLVFDGNTLDVAIGADLLDSLKSRFALRVTSEHHVQCLEELNDGRERTRLGEQLRALHRRVSEGVRSGKYRVLPEPSTRTADFDGKLPKSELLLEPLFELLGQPTAPGAWIWIDDRACTSYTYAAGNPIVSTFEVLDYLKGIQRMSEPDYFELLDRMRGANVQILPLRASEVGYWMRNAPVDDYGLTETPALRHIRVNFNRLLALEPHLDLDDPPRHVGRLPERSCLLDAFRIARDCLEEIWESNEVSEERRLGSADWVWTSLRVERFARLPQSTDPVVHRKLWQNTICQLIFLAFGLSTQAGGPNERTRRQAYLRWLEHQMLDLTGEGDPTVLEALAASVAQYLVGVLDRQPAEPTEERPVPREAVRIFIGQFISDLPEALRQRLHSSDELNAAVKPNIQTIVTLASASFEAVGFWNALSRATRNDSTTIKTLTGAEYEVHADSETEFRLVGTQSIQFNNADCALVSPDLAKRRQFLAGETWLDPELLPPELGGIDGISPLESPAERMRVLQEQRERLPSGRYATLRQLMESGQDFAVDLLVPAEAELYARYLGIQFAPDGTVDWNRSAAALLDRVGMDEVLVRWSGLPIPLPETIHVHYAAQSSAGREAILANLGTGDSLSPLLAFKLLELDCRILGAGSSASSGIDARLSSLLSGWTMHAGAFIAVLRWSDRVWHRDPTWHTLSPAARLACVWAHAGQILGLLLVRGGSAEVVIENFGTFHHSSLRHLLPFDVDYNSDIATPRRLSAPALLMHGLSAAGGDDPAGVLNAHLANVLEHLSQLNEQGRVPSPALIADRRFGRNALGSFLARPATGALVQQVDIGGIPILSDEGKDQLREQTIAQLEQNAVAPEPWGLIHMIGYEWLPIPEAQRAERVIRSLPVPDGSINDGSILIGHALAAILPYCDAETHVLFQEWLIGSARCFSAALDIPVVDIHADTKAGKAAALVIEQAVSVARRPTMGATAPELGGLCTSLATVWPAFAPTLRALLGRTLRELPSSDGENLWEAYVKLRAAI